MLVRVLYPIVHRITNDEIRGLYLIQDPALNNRVQVSQAHDAAGPVGLWNHRIERFQNVQICK